MENEFSEACFAISSALASAQGDPYCEARCDHGGVCEKREGHDGQHDNRYCQW